MRYIRGMTEVASRELRNDTRGLLRRVEAGEDIVITVDGDRLRPCVHSPNGLAGLRGLTSLAG